MKQQAHRLPIQRDVKQREWDQRIKHQLLRAGIDGGVFVLCRWVAEPHAGSTQQAEIG